MRRHGQPKGQRARQVWVRGCDFDGSPHWEHPALLVREESGLLVTQTGAGLEIATTRGPWNSPFDTRGHYWPDRWFNVIRLEDPGPSGSGRLNGFYCNIATPVQFDGENLRYVDLQLDVRVYAEGDPLRYELLDEDEFEAARERFQYAEELVWCCRRAVEEVIALVEAREFPFDR